MLPKFPKRLWQYAVEHEPRIRHRLRQLLLFLYACVVLGCFTMVIGPFLNDQVINEDPGRGLATVIDTGRFRTSVEYQDEQGKYHLPEKGLLYPTGLGQGQRVWVTYAKTQPDLVKVEGRTWTLSFIPAGSCLVVSTIVFALLWWLIDVCMALLLRRRKH
ncbi:DUF3592 domain-containing protein [Corynebacterium sp. sy017]|uniref:DUF3592 domain-containing protein n=1 Tax=unclassified Corynebacterium TaxID=2624378 RepID=UPI001186FB2E|nr:MULTISPECIES: DUF3592 domain-containing protein [unclassified Corynebacterium]MBP3089292.1 DUF3592 domain-containing protein [Corynebacterium sp. sy017]QDZ43614.1 DUF3592 domain-containing protein [Corynebacterium sp. sy039]TSD91119.1 DUF3592 domain-containing protein [Corynebacterium sp. SY003]